MRGMMTVLKSAGAGAGLFAVCACATGAKFTLEERFRDIGIPPRTAACMVDDLSDSLDNADLRDLARYTNRISRAPSGTAAIEQLLRIDNPRAVAAIGAAAFTCVTGVGR